MICTYVYGSSICEAQLMPFASQRPRPPKKRACSNADRLFGLFSLLLAGKRARIGSREILTRTYLPFGPVGVFEFTSS